MATTLTLLQERVRTKNNWEKTLTQPQKRGTDFKQLNVSRFVKHQLFKTKSELTRLTGPTSSMMSSCRPRSGCPRSMLFLLSSLPDPGPANQIITQTLEEIHEKRLEQCRVFQPLSEVPLRLEISNLLQWTFNHISHVQSCVTIPKLAIRYIRNEIRHLKPANQPLLYKKNPVILYTCNGITRHIFTVPNWTQSDGYVIERNLIKSLVCFEMVLSKVSLYCWCWFRFMFNELNLCSEYKQKSYQSSSVCYWEVSWRSCRGWGGGPDWSAIFSECFQSAWDQESWTAASWGTAAAGGSPRTRSSHQSHWRDSFLKEIG